MSAPFWAFVAIVILMAALFVIRLLKGKKHGLGSLSVSDSVNLTVNTVMLVLTLISIAIALAAFQDSKSSGNEQKKALDASRDSLRDVVFALKTQTSLLNDAQHTLQSQLEVSRQQQRAITATNSVLQSSKRTLKSQLDIATEQNKREIERLNRKPQIHLAIRAGNNVLQEEQFSQFLVVRMDDFSNLSVIVTNTGDAALNAPNITLMALPSDEVEVLPIGMVYADGQRHSAFQFTGPTVPQSLEPFTQSRTQYPFSFRISPIERTTDALLVIRIFGNNMRVKEGLTHLKIVWPAATP